MSFLGIARRSCRPRISQPSSTHFARWAKGRAASSPRNARDFSRLTTSISRGPEDVSNLQAILGPFANPRPSRRPSRTRSRSTSPPSSPSTATFPPSPPAPRPRPATSAPASAPHRPRRRPSRTTAWTSSLTAWPRACAPSVSRRATAWPLASATAPSSRR